MLVTYLCSVMVTAIFSGQCYFKVVRIFMHIKSLQPLYLVQLLDNTVSPDVNRIKGLACRSGRKPKISPAWQYHPNTVSLPLIRLSLLDLEARIACDLSTSMANARSICCLYLVVTVVSPTTTTVILEPSRNFASSAWIRA